MHPERSPKTKSLLTLAWTTLKRYGVPALSAVAIAVIVSARAQTPRTSDDDPELVGPPWRGRVVRLRTDAGKLEVCAPTGSACHEARENDAVPAGSLLQSDRVTRAELSFSDGSRISLAPASRLRLSTRGRGGELLDGALIADISRREDWSARFDFQTGHLDALGCRFSLEAESGAATVRVARGAARLSDNAGHDVLLQPGEEGQVLPDSPPTSHPAASLIGTLGTGDALATAADAEPEARPRALGELVAKKPGELSERSGAVRLQSHAVRVSIAGGIARTEVEEVFANQTDETLEGIFRFPLPTDAQLERLALDVDGRLQEGAFVERDRASAIWRGSIVNAAPALKTQTEEPIVWVPGPWRDPALLEWQRGGRFELRVFPVPRRGSRRLILAYSQRVQQSGGLRRYSYPLAVDPRGRGVPLDFSFDVQLLGHDPHVPVKTPGWNPTRTHPNDTEHLHFDATDFVAAGDFGVDYALADRDSELSAWAYRESETGGDGQPYLALALRPKLPHRASAGQPGAIALVVDASRSEYGENYRRAVGLASRIARELSPENDVTVLACDSTCRQMPGAIAAPGEETAREVRLFLEQEKPAGASDVTLAVARGFEAIAGIEGARNVVYIGDGVATVGPTRSSTIERAVRSVLPERGRVTALGVGPESDGESLRALARGGQGVALPYLPGQSQAEAVSATLMAIYGSVLGDVRLELPEGVSEVSPARIDAIEAGSEFFVTARFTQPSLGGMVVLRGTLNGRPFERRYQLDVTAAESSGNGFVPRLFAASRIAELERDGSDGARREAIRLSTHFGVASRYTSLLVLESEAMYRAFGLDSGRKQSDYTADAEAEGTSSSGELAERDDAAARDQPHFVAADKAASTPAKPSEQRAAPRNFEAPAALDGAGSVRGFAPPPPSPPVRAPAAHPLIPRHPERLMVGEGGEPVYDLPERTWIPMRRIWERHGEIFTARFAPRAAANGGVQKAERDLRRQDLTRAFALASAAGELNEAARLAQLWVEKEPLGAEALTALADVEARRGNRDQAIRMLGSVLDAHPTDTAAHKRLARLERWAGHAELACRHSIAVAEGRSHDVPLLAEAIGCARRTDMIEIADALLSATNEADRAALERELRKAPPDPSELRGDVRLEASFSGGPDIDLSLLDTEGHRISWLGAATKSVISARDVTSTSHEGLALRGAAPGEYVVELTRGAGSGAARGELVLSVAGDVRRIPFYFDGDRKTIALLRISMVPRLVPL